MIHETHLDNIREIAQRTIRPGLGLTLEIEPLTHAVELRMTYLQTRTTPYTRTAARRHLHNDILTTNSHDHYIETEIRTLARQVLELAYLHPKDDK